MALRFAFTTASLALAALVGCHDAPSEPQDFSVDGRVGLASLMALGDGHLQQIANDFQMLGARAEARSADWERIAGPLGAVAQLNVPSLMWFAHPDGSYWSVQLGRAAGDLSDRPY